MFILPRGPGIIDGFDSDSRGLGGRGVRVL